MSDSVRDRWYLRPGIWFWVVIALGAAVRFYLVVFTEGTYDVTIWEQHARGVSELGLFDYYHSSPKANHPPFILEAESLLWRGAQSSGIPFRVLLRAPFACLDVASAMLLLNLLGFHRWRFPLVAGYWLNPLSVILSGYQGNTDSVVAFALLFCVWSFSREKIATGAVAIGASLWIKLPGILAIPALVLYLQGWRRRLLFLSVVGLVTLVGYFPALVRDANVIALNVFGYHGRLLQTPAGVPVWGLRVLFFSIIAAPEKWPEYFHSPVVFLLQHSWQIAVACALALGLLRRSRSIPELCATIAILYLPIYGLTDFWAFQYFSWSLPFWFFLRPWFSIAATFLGSAYIYSLYWTLCGNGWLLGQWDFAGKLYWPGAVLIFRNLSVLFFFVCACGFLIAAIWHQFNRLRLRSAPTENLFV